ncbi:MAG: RidA family protein [Verrucomicrobiales bacterium]|nr:RidA family protein [Verrucomicrobiales bacterium]
MDRFVALALLSFLAIQNGASREPLTYFGNGEAVKVQRGGLVHTRLLSALRGKKGFDGLVGQIAGIARAHDATLGDVAKLNLYVSNPNPAMQKSIRTQMARHWPNAAKQPALTIIPSALPGGGELAGDAVIAIADGGETGVTRFERDAAVLPASRDAVFVSGRAASGELAVATAGTMTQLFDVLNLLGAGKKDVVQVKAFIKPMTGWETVEAEIEKSFGEIGPPPVVYVEWTSGSRATEIELIAAAPKVENPEGPISYFTPPADKPSPVFSRVARVHGDEIIYISGMTGPKVDTADAEIHSLFGELKRVSQAAGSDLRHFAKATYYVSKDGVSKSLNALRPEYYDPKRPPAASKVQVHSTGVPDRGMLIDMIAVPTGKE